MSLLLDALKKAEKAKDQARRRTQGSDGTNDDDSVLQVRTRNELPDISAPLEMHSEDIPGNAAQVSDSPVPDAFYTAPATRPTPEPSEPVSRNDSRQIEPPRRNPARASEPASDPQASQRAAAKNVFEAKFREPNPKLPFYITMAFLGAFAAGTVVYFWYQLRPPPPLVNTSGKPPPDEKRVDTPAPAPVAAAAPAPAAAASAIPGLPAAPAAERASTSASSAPPGASSAPQSAARAASPTDERRASAPAATAAPKAMEDKPVRARKPPAGRPTPTPDPSKLSVNPAKPELNPKLEAGWAAYNQGNLAQARSNYQAVLLEEPANRDALLGMAAIEMRANQHEQAELYYQKVLDANPRDPYAMAGMMALRAKLTDPIQTESRVKSLLLSDPDAHVLYFTLGNELAQQGRWPEAQQAYFKAFSSDPENPDFAYNLAVSLDHARQPKLALEYYRRALSLAQQRSSSFDQALARNRAQELSR